MKRSANNYEKIDTSGNAAHWVKLMHLFPEKFPETHIARQTMIDWILEKPGDRILDAGCGTGETTRQLAENLPTNTEIIGMDFSDAMLDFACNQSNPNNITYQQGDIRQLPFPDAHFDVVRVERVLHHVKEAKQAFADIARVLKPGGRLVINEPDFTACRMAPLSFDLNIAYNIHYNRTMAYGHIGGELHALAQDVGLTRIHHNSLHYFGRDYAWLDEVFNGIDLLREVLTEQNNMAFMQTVEQAAQTGIFYWAPCFFNLCAEKA